MPPSQWLTYKQTEYSGENRIPSIEAIQPDQLMQAINMQATADGTLETRLGKTAINATLGAGGITALWRYAKANGTDYLVVQHGTTLYSGTWDGTGTVTLASVKTGLNAAKLRGQVWKDKLILGNGIDNSFAFDGAACTDLTGAPKFTIFRVYANRIFCMDYDNPNQLRWSALEDFNSWDALDVALIRDADGDKVTGLAVQPGGMVIFKNNSSFVFYGTNKDDFRLVQLSERIGCVATDSIIDDGIMVSQDNIYTFSLSSIQPFSQTHRSVISGLSINDRATICATAQTMGKRVVLSLNADTQLNIEINTGGITSWLGLNVGCVSVADAEGDDGSILIGDATNGIVHVLNNVGTDNGTAIYSALIFPYTDNGSTRKKLWRVFLPETTVLNGYNTDGTATINVGYEIDRSGTSFVSFFRTYSDVLIWGAGNWNEKDWAPVNLIAAQPWYMSAARGYRISFRMTSNSRIRLDSIKVKYRELSDYI